MDVSARRIIWWVRVPVTRSGVLLQSTMMDQKWCNFKQKCDAVVSSLILDSANLQLSAFLTAAQGTGRLLQEVSNRELNIFPNLVAFHEHLLDKGGDMEDVDSMLFLNRSSLSG
ncbi:hypothetical protein BSKO_05762 [Bryopsis sp. KO-2023]|nr:hypothetical protein BSKO_05762 [Bryopsis sp. KO-2023]